MEDRKGRDTSDDDACGWRQRVPSTMASPRHGHHDSKADGRTSGRRWSKRPRTGGHDQSPGLVTDGLRAERVAGHTIDAAYRYFATPKRKFITSTPGTHPIHSATW